MQYLDWSKEMHNNKPEEEEAVEDDMEHSEDFLEPREEGELGGEHCCCSMRLLQVIRGVM